MTDHAKTGSIVRIIGPVLDVRFDEGAEPALKTLLVTETEPPVHVEVVQHYAPGVVRSIALEPTEGLYCGVTVTNTGAGIRVPVGENVLGRVIDCLGRPHPAADRKAPGHRHGQPVRCTGLHLRGPSRFLAAHA